MQGGRIVFNLTVFSGVPGLKYKSAKLSLYNFPSSIWFTVKFLVKGLGVYNFIRGFGWACKREGAYIGGGGGWGIYAE